MSNDPNPPAAFTPWTYNERIRHGRQFAALHSKGHTIAEISTITSESIPRIRLALSSIGYDPAKVRHPKSKPPATLPNGRPIWSIPSSLTLSLVREARTEAPTFFNQDLL